MGRISDTVVRDIYGSYSGMYMDYKHRVLWRLGYYRHFLPELPKVSRFVFVCKGNICRSAFAESVAKTYDLNAVSCGIDTMDGKVADSVASRVASDMGYDLADHKTRRVQGVQLYEDDLIVAMEPGQAQWLSERGGNVTLLGLFGRPAKPFIKDPYGASDNYYRACFRYIEHAVHEISKKY